MPPTPNAVERHLLAYLMGPLWHRAGALTVRRAMLGVCRRVGRCPRCRAVPIIYAKTWFGRAFGAGMKAAGSLGP